MKSISNKTKTILFASLIALMAIPIAMSQSIEAHTGDTCPERGNTGIYRCYATKIFYPTSASTVSNIDVKLEVDDITPNAGFVQSALWTYLSNGHFVEIGFNDTSGEEKIVCGRDGGTQGGYKRVYVSDGDSIKAYTIKQSNGHVWKTGMKHTESGDKKSCTYTLNANQYATATSFEVGSEASKSNSGNFMQYWKDVELNYSKVTPSTISSTNHNEKGSHFDVDDCRSGNTALQQHEAGKGVASC